MSFIDGLSVRMMTHEQARIGQKDVVEAIRDVAYHEDIACMMVVRAFEGSSLRGGMRSYAIVDLAADLPVSIEIVGGAESIEQMLPRITAQFHPANLTVTRVRFCERDG